MTTENGVSLISVMKKIERLASPRGGWIVFILMGWRRPLWRDWAKTWRRWRNENRGCHTWGTVQKEQSTRRAAQEERAAGDEVGEAMRSHTPEACWPLEGLWVGKGGNGSVNWFYARCSLKEESRILLHGWKGGIKMTSGFLTRENFLVSMKDIFWGARLHISGSEWSSSSIRYESRKRP